VNNASKKPFWLMGLGKLGINPNFQFATEELVHKHAVILNTKINSTDHEPYGHFNRTTILAT
jgi:hypothetical protein